MAEDGPDQAEREAEHGKDAEAEDYGFGQVDADGGHHLAVERPAVDRVTPPAPSLRRSRSC
jgi:hypothetical protein